MAVLQRAGPLPLAALAAVTALAWQTATMWANFGGDPTALYCTGAGRGVPESLAGERIWLVPGSQGYDGQFYHYIAHDPLQRDPALAAFVDAPRLRYRRVLIPALAYLSALGEPSRIDPAYRALILLSIFAGVYWSARWCESRGWPPAGGLAFLVLPASMVAVDRLTPDVVLAALAIGLLLPGRTPAAAFAMLAAAALTRETGMLLIAAWCVTRGVKFALAAAPALVWYGYVFARTEALDYGAGSMPLAAIARAFANPPSYPLEIPLQSLVRLGDFAALTGVALAFVLALLALRRDRSFQALAAAAFALMGCLLQRDDHWRHVYDFGRVYSPLLALLAARAVEERRWIWAAPCLMMAPRLAMQLAPQALGVIRAMAG